MFNYSISGASDPDHLLDEQDPDADKRRQGYIGGGTFGINNNLTQDAPASWSPDGQGEKIVDGYRQMGSSQYDQDVDRYRKMGADGMKRQGAQLDQGQADQSRGLQMGALGMLGSAARGNEPSRAVELSHASNDTATRGALAATGGARGPGAAVAAMNQAQNGAGARMAQQNAALTEMRGGEMATNQNVYAAGAQAARGQDINAATANAKLQAQQRALNEQRQENMEKLGFDVRKTQSQGADRYARDKAAADDLRNRNIQQRDALDAQHVNNAESDFASLVMMASDDRAKTRIHPMTMGSLSGLSRFMHGRR